MHRALPVALILSAAACAPSSVDLTLRGELDANTAGVVLDDDARTARAGMVDMICEVDTLGIAVTADYDVAVGQTETVIDAHRGESLVLSDGHLFQLGLGGDSAPVDLDVAVVDARLLDDGVAAVFRDEAGCGVAFAGADTVGWRLSEITCDAPAVAVDRAGGVAWVADGEKLASIDRDGNGVTFPAADADLIAWNGRDDTVVLAARNGSWVRAVHADGSLAWQAMLEGSVAGLDAAADAGVVVVSMASGDAEGTIIVLAGDTGLPIVEHLVPETPDVTLSSDGRSLALVTNDTVRFYDVEPDAHPLDTPTSAEVSDANGAATGAILGVPVATAAAVALVLD